MKILGKRIQIFGFFGAMVTAVASEKMFVWFLNRQTHCEKPALPYARNGCSVKLVDLAL
jgi:hypothetical protein